MALLFSIGFLGFLEPAQSTWVIAWFAVAVAFFSASQDVVLDAYRREILPDAELGMGNAIHVQAYRISNLVPGSLSLILADVLPWSSVFLITAAFMLVEVVLTLVISEPESDVPAARGLRKALTIPFEVPLRYLFAVHPQAMGKVLGVIYPAISTHLIHKAGYQLQDGATGAVTLIQRFGSALNLNIHFHILFLDGVYVYRDGTPQVAFDPMGFIARLAALVPKPRVNLTRYHGVLAPNHRWRGLVTPAKRGKGAMRRVDSDVVSSIQRHAAMTWAQRLKRVFKIDSEVCSRCGGSVRVIACIEDQDVIDRILAHLRKKEQGIPTLPLLTPHSFPHLGPA